MFLHYDFEDKFSDKEKEQLEIAINDINSIKVFANNFIDLFSKANNSQGNLQDTLYDPSINELLNEGYYSISESLIFLKQLDQLKNYYYEPYSSINQDNYSQFLEDFNSIEYLYQRTLKKIKKIKPKNPLLKKKIKELLGKEKNFKKGINWFKNTFISIKNSFIDDKQNLSKENIEPKLKISIEDNNLTDEEKKQLENSQQIMINFYKNNLDKISILESLNNFVENLYDNNSFYCHYLQDADFLFQLYERLEYNYTLLKFKLNSIISLEKQGNKLNDKRNLFLFFSSITPEYNFVLDQIKKYKFKDENIKDQINKIFKTSDTKEKKEAKNEALTDKEKQNIENIKQEIDKKYLKLQNLQKFLKESEKTDKELDGLHTFECYFFDTINYMLSNVFNTKDIQNITLTENNYQELSKAFNHWNFCYDYLILDELKNHEFKNKEFESEIKRILEDSNTGEPDKIEENNHLTDETEINKTISFENSDTTLSKTPSSVPFTVSESKGKEQSSVVEEDSLPDDIPIEDISQDNTPPLNENYEDQDNDTFVFDTENQIEDKNKEKIKEDEKENSKHPIFENKTIDNTISKQIQNTEQNIQEIQEDQKNKKDHILAKILLGLIAEKEVAIENEEDNEKKDQIINEQSFNLKRDSKDNEGINITKKDDFKEFKFSSSNIINNKLNGANDTIELNNGMENSINIRHNANTNPALSSVSASISALYEKMKELKNTPFTFNFNSKTPTFENAIYETLFKNLKNYDYQIMEAICIKNDTNINITIKIQDLQNLEFQNVDELKKYINNKKSPYSNGSSELKTRIPTLESEDYPFSQNQRT